MIISLRGTQASGKSHIVRSIMSLYPKKEETRLPGRRKPTGYKLHGLGSPLFVPGYYEADVGGTGTLVDMTETYDMIWEAYDAGFSVLYEGSGVYDGTSRLTNMFHSDVTEVVIVDHLISECVMSIKDRGGKIRVETIQKYAKKISADEEIFKARGYSVRRLNRQLALERCKELLEIFASPLAIDARDVV